MSDILPEPDDPFEREFLLQLGLTLARWQWVEQTAFFLYSAVARPGSMVTISINWHHLQSFDSRITLLERVIHLYLTDEMDGDWLPLLKKLKNASAVRNRIVHGHVENQGPDKSPLIKPIDVDMTNLMRKRFGNPNFIFDTDRLKKEGQSFARLGDEVMAFERRHFPHGAEDKIG